MEPVLETSIPGLPRSAGKVRDVYDLGDRLLIVATDRISAFDWVLPTGIPDKGRVLTALTLFWLGRLEVPNHLLSTDLSTLDGNLPEDQVQALEGRSMIVRKAQVIPFECVVRGALAGSGWKEYRTSQAICGHPLPPNLRESDRIDPIFTPATKAVSGHDENVPVSRLETDLGIDRTRQLEALSLRIYSEAADYARSRGLILADTKFEFGTDPKTGELLLIDEVLTPDSSRYWAIDDYEPGRSQPSFDKQFVRDWLETTGWDKASPPPSLPADVVEKTRSKYLEAYQRLTGLEFPWT